MSNLIPYILKLSISLCVIYLFYQLFLRRLTFYTWNRWYLLLYSIFCFALPFINVFTFVTEPAPDEPSLIRFIPVIDYVPQHEVTAFMDWKQVAVIVLLAGIVLFMIRLLIQYLSLVKMRTKAKLIYDSSVKLYHIDKPVIPFSFGNAIYINQHQHSQQELSDIIRHEFIHVKQRHTVDMLWSEILCILNWYNPFAWLLKKAIRQNLEFIADHQVLQAGFDRKQYQYLLLKVIGTSTFSIASNFNFSSLKKRIAMMNKSKSARVNLLRFLFILPMLAVILLAFRNIKQEQKNELKEQQVMILEQPVMEQEPVHVITVPKTDTVPQKVVITYKTPKEPKVKPEDIQAIHVTKQDDAGIITITLKNGDVDVFNLSKEEDRKKYTEKYDGELPKIVKVTPVDPLKEVVVEGYAAPKPAPVPASVNEKGYYVTIADNNGECVVIVKNKDQKIVEAVTLTDWNKDENYKQKYGDIPPIPPVKPVQIRIGKPAQIKQPAQPAKPAQPISFSADQVKPSMSIKADNRKMNMEWAVVIDTYSSREKLESIKADIASHGFKLDIRDVSYTDGLMKTFNALIISPDGKEGSVKLKDISKYSIVIFGGKDGTGKDVYGVETKPKLISGTYKP
jgi:beta-lactamase regulating signal transducer with metallopeptidase domain